MERVLLKVQGITKRFRQHKDPPTLFRAFKRLIHKSSHQEIWSLQGITFEARKGEKIGLIGNNGAGKTTLLRIIAGIYKQTAGTIKIDCSMASCLQIGLGMQRELTVIENIHLIGSLMGMQKKQIVNSLKEIISFSELKDFAYYPLKDLSFGMIQRLLISIAKHVDTEILLWDEMLIGGDCAFREKCFHMLEQHKQSEKTMIIASHDLELVQIVCDKALFLERGKQMAFGPAGEVIAYYKKQAG